MTPWKTVFNHFSLVVVFDFLAFSWYEGFWKPRTKEIKTEEIYEEEVEPEEGRYFPPKTV